MKKLNVISNLPDVRRRFWEYFGFPLPLDEMTTGLVREIIIDIRRMDAEMDKRIAEYNPEECMYEGRYMSMRGVVKEVYGDQALNFFENLINPEL